MPKYQLKDGHGIADQLNAHILDVEDACTGYGQHERVVACCPDAEGLYCRVDVRYSLPIPTPEQVLKAAKARNGKYQRGKWTLKSTFTSDDGKTIDFNFVQVRE
jgi:hypothetical protein